MKKLFFAASIFLQIIAPTTTVNAQYRFIRNNEKIISPVSRTTREFINTRPLRKFIKAFPGVTDDVWIKNNTGFIVTFTFKQVRNLAFLTKTGDCDSRIQYYTENELPAGIRHQVKSTYYDYSITSVKEVSGNHSTAYLVTIEDKTKWMVIRVADGEMDVWEDHVKS